MSYALIVIDFIEDYFDARIWPYSAIPPLRGRISQAVNELVSGCRSAGVPIIWVRQEFSEDMSDAFPHAKRAGMRYAIRGTKGSGLLSELDVRPADAVLTKRRFSAFFGTSLEALLAEYGATTLILAGITTAWCVRSTAVDAYQRDLEVLLASDCMAAFSEAAHDESLAAMDGYIAVSQSNAEIALRVGSGG